MVLTFRILRNFNRNLKSGLRKNGTVSPIVLGSPFSFVSQYAVHILGEKQNFVQVHCNMCMTAVVLICIETTVVAFLC